MPLCFRCDLDRPASWFRPRSRICRQCLRRAEHLSRLPRRLRAKRFVAKVRARIPCTHCQRVGCIEWHNEAHIENPSMRVGNLAGCGRSLARIKAEMRASTPVCRHCHMKIDGRSAALTESRPFKKGDRLPPRPCAACDALTRVIRHGLCNRCDKWRRKANRPSVCTDIALQMTAGPVSHDPY